MSGLLIGYARVSTEEQDLTAQRDGLAALGVETARIYVDHGLSGSNRERPGLREALAACRAGDTLVVTKLDRLARSLPDARAIAEDLTKRKVRLSLGASVYDPTDPVGRLLFNVLAMVAELPTSSDPGLARACALRKRKVISEESNPNSTRARKRIWSNCCTPVSTRPWNSLTCSVSLVRRSTALSSAARPQPPPDNPPPRHLPRHRSERWSPATSTATRRPRCTGHDTARPATFHPRTETAPDHELRARTAPRKRRGEHQRRRHNERPLARRPPPARGSPAGNCPVMGRHTGRP